MNHSLQEDLRGKMNPETLVINYIKRNVVLQQWNRGLLE